MTGRKKRPEWSPESAGREFASEVRPGVIGGHDGLPGQSVASSVKRRQFRAPRLTSAEYVAGILAGDRTILARAITLIESNSIEHITRAQEVLREVLPRSGRSIRIGITGVPGVGKSSLIENFGLMLCAAGHQVAVLAVDPSSPVSGGSILGDKTRMEHLARNERAFIRPSPSSGVLGGIARKTRETILVCEAAGYDVILVETVGVGQGEVMVRSMVDFFLLLALAGAGDELQGLKKGVVELADCILVNKADGDNLSRTSLACAEYKQVLHYLQPATAGWKTHAMIGSAHTGLGLPELWQMITQFKQVVDASGLFNQRRSEQKVEWFKTILQEGVLQRFYHTRGIPQHLARLEREVASGALPPTAAAQELLTLLY